MDFGRYVFAEPYLGWLCRGALMTLLIATATGGLSVLLGIVISAGRQSPSRWRRAAAAVYVNTFRNLPPVPLLLFLVFALPGLWRSVTGLSFPRGTELGMLIAGLSLNTSAYVAEIIRSGLRGVQAEQWQAGRVLGLSPRAVSRWVVYPQAIRIVLPALTTRLIHNMKNSSVALVLPLSTGAMELTGQASRIAGQTFAWAEPLVFVACVYLLLTLAMSTTLGRLARAAQQKVEAGQ